MSQYFEAIPDYYRCYECEARDCKMWRQLRGQDGVKPYCANCACRSQNIDIATLDAKGLVDGWNGIRTTQIGLYLPAIPMNDESGFYHERGAAPEAAIQWWTQLASRPA